MAHELGHFLTLDDSSSDAADTPRLMFPAVGIDPDRKLLTADEVAAARASAGGAFECVPLTIKVTGATQMGGTLSNQFIVIQDAAKVVTVQAQISDELLAEGAVTMTGGTPGANDRERTVSAAAAGPPVEIVATYTPNNGGDVVSTRSVVLVVTFDLRVTGDGVKQVNATTFAVPRGGGKVASIVADLQPPPFCVPESVVAWEKGIEAGDFLRRTLSQAAPASTSVSATIAGVKKTVTVVVFEIALVNNATPPGPALANVLVEGVLNQDLKNFEVGSLFSTQPNSLFRAHATLPGVATNPLPAVLTQRDANGTFVASLNLNLTKTGDDFRSALPILAVPAAVKSDLTLPKTMSVLFAHAGDKLVLSIPTVLGGISSGEVVVRARTVFLFAETFTDANNSAADLKATVADVRRQIARSNRIWAQVGIEIRERSIQIVADPGAPPGSPADGLIELDDNGTNVLTPDEQRLLGQIAGGPAHSVTATDLNVYYVKEIKGPPSGLSFTGRAPACIAIEGPSVTDSALAHENGHWLLVNWPVDDHKDLNGNSWPDSNVMHNTDTGGGDVDRTQAINILPNGSPVLVVLP